MADQYRIKKWSEPHFPNAAMLRHLMVVEGYRVFQWCDRPGMMYGMHKHGEHQSHWIVSGSLEITIQSVGVVVLQAGDRDFMPAETYHSARVIGDEPVLYLIGEKIIVEEQPARPKRRASKKKETE